MKSTFTAAALEALRAGTDVGAQINSCPLEEY